MQTTKLDGQPLGGFVDTKKATLFRNVGTSILRITCLEFTNNSAATVNLSVFQTEEDGKSNQIVNLSLLPRWTKVLKEERLLNLNAMFEAVTDLNNVVSWRANYE